MTWQDHIDFDRCEPSPTAEAYSPSHMTPGLTDTYDRELREKASVRDTPIPIEYLGLEGEYDRCGLAKRVAQALDDHENLAHLDSLSLAQKGNGIAFWGRVPNHTILDAVINTASRVDGTHEVDVTGVSIEHTQK
jgi:hypothetical protein